MISVCYLILDEASAYPHDADGRGSPIDQARARQKVYADTAKEFVPSTPGTAGECVVLEMYDKGDRRRCYLPCPHCGVFQTLTYEKMQGPGAETGSQVTFACAAADCGRSIYQTDLVDMESRLEWVPTRVEEDETPVPVTIPSAEIKAYAILPCKGRVAKWQPSWALWPAYSQMER